MSVYARVSPEHKIRIVNAWKRKGKIVAMTGDGVNDAPALKSADIGVAMGITGTEVSKDAAAMILADDNFATIVKAVVNGRGVYTNIKNAITFLLSGNMAGIFSVLVTSILGLPNPFLPVHLLFINLLTDSLPAIAIGVEPATGDLLSQKPRDPKEPILSRSLMGRIGVYGLLIAAATMEARAKKESQLRDYLIDEVLRRVPYTRCNGSRDSRLPNNASFCFRFIEGESLLIMLDMKGICGSSGSACTSGSLDPSHVLLAIGLPHEIAHGSLRLTLGEDTTKEDIDRTIEAICEIVERLRSMSPLYEDFVKKNS